MPRVSGDVLTTGQTLHVAREHAPDDALAVTVASVRHGLIWVSGSETLGSSGERVLMECRVLDDAIYRAQGKVEFVPPESWALRRVGEWERRQRREWVRVAVWKSIDVEITHAADETGIGSFPMLDLGGGGMRIATQGAAGDTLVPGAQLYCVFELPEAGAFELRAQVLRADPPAQDGAEGSAALRFVEVDPEVEAELSRWVQYEKMRRRS